MYYAIYTMEATMLLDQDSGASTLMVKYTIEYIYIRQIARFFDQDSGATTLMVKYTMKYI